MEILTSLFSTAILAVVLAFLVWEIGNALDKH